MGDERPLSTCRFSPADGGGLVLSASWSGNLRLWNAAVDGKGGNPGVWGGGGWRGKAHHANDTQSHR